MLEWFKKLSEGWQTAIFGAGVVVALAVIGGLFALLKWLFRKKDDPAPQQKTIHQKGSGNKAAVINASGSTANIAEGDIHTGIDGDLALKQLVRVSKQAGQSEEKNKNYEEKIKQLEEQLSQSQIMANTGEQQVPQPTQEAKALAAQIEDDAGPYAQALKAIADGKNEKADQFLDETQELLDHVQEQKDRAQAKIYMARMRNASYAGSPQDALKYCDRLATLAADDSLIINKNR